MIRTLFMIAVAGFLVSAVTLSVAVAITGPAAIANGAWTWSSHGWGWRRHDHVDDSRDDGAQTSREFDWQGGDHLIVSVPAEVIYTQSDGPAKATVSGSPSEVGDVRVEDGRIRYDDDRHDDDRRLKIAISAPAVTDFALEGDDSLDIKGYKQDRLTLTLSGHADVKAAGEARDVQVRISGAGRADLAAVKAKSARVLISGLGSASIAPTDAADVDISGSGAVTLLTNPPQLHTNITGSGQIHRPGM
jgi:hypothetical protein